MARYCPNCSSELRPPEADCWKCGAIFGNNSHWIPLDEPLGVSDFSSKNKTAFSFYVLALWAVSTFIAFVMSIFSVNGNVIAVVLLGSFGCLGIATILISRGWAFTGYLVALSPAPGLLGIVLVASSCLGSSFCRRIFGW